MQPSIAVIYLARLAEGFDNFRIFSESYREHPAGRQHDLILLAKGFRKPGEYAALRALFADFPHRIISVRDDIGLDIHAYKAAAKQLNHSHLVFFNTFSEIAASDWLSKMAANCLAEKVGAVGVCGSFESLYDSVKVINKVRYLTIHQTLIRSIANFLRPVLKFHAVPWMLSKLRSKMLLSIAEFAQRLARLRSKSADHEFEQLWAGGASVDGPLSRQIRFPRFPNPHLRSNALMVDRSVFLRVPVKGADKFACFEFESGYDGLSHTLLLDGLRLLVVGADGRGYDIAEWPKSNTFRLDGQKNLLIHDNQTRKFDHMGSAEKELHRTMTWGGYDSGARHEIVGIDFGAAQPIRDIGNFGFNIARDRGLPMISVVIPTRNRAHLLNEVLATILKEPYPNYEVIIFDNASNPPVNIRQLPGSNHIRVVRSDALLNVTSCWNKATDLAVGDYMILIGDDDGLCPRFFDRVAALVQEFEKPDLIYSAYYRFPHPGALPSHPTGYVAKEANGFFFRDRRYPFVMNQATVKAAVSGSLRMRQNFGFDMQGMIFRRAFLESLRRVESVLHSPLPDCYIANVALAKAARVVVEPRPITIASISRPLVSDTRYERRENDGRRMSKNEITNDPAYSRCRDRLLPGSLYDSAYILAMQHVADTVGEKFEKPDYARYRKKQILPYVEKHGIAGLRSQSELGAEFWSRLSRREKLWAMRVAISSKAFPQQFSSICKKLDHHAFTPAMIIQAVGEYTNTSQVHRALERRAIV